MKDSDFYRLVRNERNAFEYLEKKIWRREWKKCPFCKTTRPYSLASGRYRCRSCRKEFRSWAGRWLGMLRIQASHWLWIIRSFEAEWTPHRVSRKLDLSYPTLLRAYHVIREAILGPEFLRELARGSKPAPVLDCPAISIREIKGKMVLSPVSLEIQAKPDDLWGCRKGNFVALQNYEGHDWLVLYDGKKSPSLHPISPRVDKGDEFRLFAIKRLNRYHGITRKYLAHYLNEIAFRYNHRREDLFELVAQALSNQAIQAR